MKYFLVLHELKNCDNKWLEICSDESSVFIFLAVAITDKFCRRSSICAFNILRSICELLTIFEVPQEKFFFYEITCLPLRMDFCPLHKSMVSSYREGIVKYNHGSAICFSFICVEYVDMSLPSISTHIFVSM